MVKRVLPGRQLEVSPGYPGGFQEVEPRQDDCGDPPGVDPVIPTLAGDLQVRNQVPVQRQQRMPECHTEQSAIGPLEHGHGTTFQFHQEDALLNLPRQVHHLEGGPVQGVQGKQFIMHATGQLPILGHQ